MKRLLIITTLLPGVVLTLTSCATRDTSSLAAASPYPDLPEILNSNPLTPVASEPAQLRWPRPITSGTTTNVLFNTPPKIIFSTQPAILVSVDGPPAYRPVPGTDLQRVINTRALLLKDKSGKHYLHLYDGYMQAPALTGPWIVAAQPPPGAAQAEKQARTTAAVDLLQGQARSPTTAAPSLTNAPPPVIYAATTPAELILFEGPPDFVPIAGTHLVYAANTTGNLFKSLTDQRTYVLISGRWFSAPSLEGPWQFVPGHLLPSDFANIPDSSPKENVKASVPGTQQAVEALIANRIPQSAEVPRTAQMENPGIDGPPQLQPIAGTPLYYVVNSGSPIIKVDDHTWYACQNGVWFVATSLEGPWTVAASVPSVIYSIPLDSPLHYLTYVQVYGATPEGVYEGYTPGYLGTEVDEDGLVVYGTGYCYPPWIGDYWYCGPVTWGLGWGCCWTPWDDWCFGPGFGWGCGFGQFGWWRCHPPAPWWGAYRNWHHPFGPVAARRAAGPLTTAARVYAPAGRAGSRLVTATRVGDAYGRAYNSRTGALAAGQRATVKNIYTSAQARMGRSGFWHGHVLAARGFANRAPTGLRSSLPQGRSYSHDGFFGHFASAFHGGGGWGGFHRGGGGFHGGGFGGGGHGGGGGHR